MNPTSAEAHDLFQRETLALHHHRVYYILLAGMAVMLLFALLDYILVPEHFSEFLRYRLFACGFGGLLIGLNYHDQQQRRAWVIGFAGYICAGIVILVMIMRMGGVTSPYYVGLIVVMTIYTAIAPLTVAQTLVSGLSLVCIYLVAMFFLDSLSSYQLLSLFSNLFFMVCFVCIAATQSWADTAARQRECRLRAEEDRAAGELARHADILEEEVKRRTREQEAAERRFQLLYDSIADQVVLVSPEGAVLQANTSYQQRFDDVALTSVLGTVSGYEREKLARLLAEAIERETVVSPCQLTLQARNGESFEAEINGVLLRRAGSVLGIQLVIRDIGTRKRLESLLVESLRRVRQTENAAILALAKLSEYRDITPGNHLERIREYCRVLAIELSRRAEFQEEITPAFLQNLFQGAILHDIGKVAISDEVLAKAGPLGEQEEEMLRNHTLKGGDVIKAMEEEAGASGFLSLAKQIAYFHHERWDGGGYPYGLQGTEIPLAARIMALADAYEEWTAAGGRSIPHSEAVERIVRSAGAWFDPVVVEAFVVRQEDFDRIRLQLAETRPSVPKPC
jgi:PAS domain S-box-containing protein